MNPLYQDVEFRPRRRPISRSGDRKGDDEQTVGIAGRDVTVLDRYRQMDALDELAVGDFLLRERAAPETRRFQPSTANVEVPFVDTDVQRVGIGSGHLDDNHDATAVFIDKDVRVGFENADPGPQHQPYNSRSWHSDAPGAKTGPTCYIIGSGKGRSAGQATQGTIWIRSVEMSELGICTRKNCSYLVATPWFIWGGNFEML